MISVGLGARSRPQFQVTETPFVKFEAAPAKTSRCQAWKFQVCPATAGRKVVVTRSRSEGSRTYRTEGGEIELPPIAVLIDRGTASAAEILAAAVRRYRDAPLVGTRSFGKGLFQQLIELEGGGALDLSVGEFLTAEGESLAGRGLTPDIEVGEGRGKDDRQLDRAIAILRDGSSRVGS